MLLYPIIAHNRTKNYFTNSLPYTASVPRVTVGNPSPAMTLPPSCSHPYEPDVFSSCSLKSVAIDVDCQQSGQFFPFFIHFDCCLELASCLRFLVSAEKGKIRLFISALRRLRLCCAAPHTLCVVCTAASERGLCWLDFPLFCLAYLCTTFWSSLFRFFSSWWTFSSPES